MREIEQIKNATVGKETREPIARTLEKIASNFNNGQNTNQEVVEARGTHSTLNARLNVIESNIGDLSKLKTKNKSSIEGALNELAKKLGIVVVPPIVEPTQWTTKSDMPYVRVGSTSSIANEKVYTIGGNGNNSNFCYDIKSNTWSTKTVIPSGVSWASSCAIGENIYVFGGYSVSEDRDVNYVYVYNTNTDTWTAKTSIPIPIRQATCNVVNGVVYLIGGYCWYKASNNYDRTLNTIYCYNPVTDTWSIKTSMPTRRLFHTSCVIDGLIYVIGGMYYTRTNNNFKIINTVECYNPVTDTWTTKASIKTEKDGIASAVLNNKIYVFGGFSGETLLDAVECYNPVTNTWENKTPNIPIKLCTANAVSNNNKIYLIGGQNSTVGIKTVYCFF